MDLALLAGNLTPSLRVGIAAAPMFLSLLVRPLVGESRAHRMALMVSATWLAMNTMLLA